MPDPLPIPSERLAYKSGYNHAVAERYVFKSRIRIPAIVTFGNVEIIPIIDGSLWIITPPYAWNGCNALPDTSRNMRSSLEHDVKCQAMRLGIISKDNEPIANEEFRERYQVDGGWRWWTRFCQTMLDNFGRNATRPHSEPHIYYAP